MANDKLWVNFCKLVGKPEWIDDPRFETNPKRVENREILLPLVEEVLASQLQGEMNASRGKYGGRKQVAEILNETERETWQEILDEMREIDDEVANEVNNLMFIFDDIVMLNDKYIQEILKEIDGRELTLALKGATGEIRDRIFSNMSKRAAEMMRDDLEQKGPVRLSEVEGAQKEILGGGS